MVEDTPAVQTEHLDNLVDLVVVQLIIVLVIHLGKEFNHLKILDLVYFP